MELTISPAKDYLALPFSGDAPVRTLCFYTEGVLRDDIRVRLDYGAPQFTAYYPLSRFRGRRLTLRADPDMELRDLQTDTPDYARAEGYPFRPEWHFAPRLGWLNDPNGLLEYTSPVTGERTYHMFYQHNPYDTVWNNMHWGHAVSRDLMRWEHRPIALAPDEEGAMFSGSAVIDRRNLLGLKEGEEDVILLYYTAAGDISELSRGKAFVQSLAWSADGGRTFRKYPGNPVLPHVADCNRDPKVFWFEELGRYVMALFLSETEGYALFASDDLLHWERFQTIRMEGEAECPDLYPLPVEGDPGDVKWVLNGCSLRYYVCDWDGARFRPVQKLQRLAAANCCASQTFAEVSDGRRIGVAYEPFMEFPEPRPISTQMSIPYRLTLRRREGRYFLRALPVEEIRGLYQGTDTYGPLELGPGRSFDAPLAENAYDISLILGDGTGPLQLELFGWTFRVDPGENTVAFEGREGTSVMPLSASGAELSLRLVTDRCGAELFTDGGTSMMAVSAVRDDRHCRLRLAGDSPGRIESLVIHRLRHRGGMTREKAEAIGQ